MSGVNKSGVSVRALLLYPPGAETSCKGGEVGEAGGGEEEGSERRMGGGKMEVEWERKEEKGEEERKGGERGVGGWRKGRGGGARTEEGEVEERERG